MKKIFLVSIALIFLAASCNKTNQPASNVGNTNFANEDEIYAQVGSLFNSNSSLQHYTTATIYNADGTKVEFPASSFAFHSPSNPQANTKDEILQSEQKLDSF